MKKFLSDFFPILLFFIAYKAYDIYVATAVAIAASVVQVAYTRLKHGKVENMHLITMVLIVTLGSLTLFLQDEIFIKWKLTVVNWLFALAFLGSQFIGKKSFLERMLDKSLSLPKAMWNKMNLSWVLFFAATGALNIYVVYHFDTDTWVNFKLFGTTILTLMFVIAQGIYLNRYLKQVATQSEET